MKRFSKIITVAALVIAGGFALSTLPVAEVYAGCSGIGCVKDGAGAADTGTSDSDPSAVIKNITNILLFILGAVAVIMIIFGGFKYVTSGGNADSVKSAKNTIMYSIVGLVVAIFAYAIVNYVIDQLGKSGGSGGDSSNNSGDGSGTTTRPGTGSGGSSGSSGSGSGGSGDNTTPPRRTTPNRPGSGTNPPRF